MAEGDGCHAGGALDLVVGDDNSVYWVNSVDPNTWFLRKVDATGGVTTLVTTTMEISALARDATYLYWLEGAQPSDVGVLKKMSLQGGPVSGG